jgi:hypothetical protein
MELKQFSLKQFKMAMPWTKTGKLEENCDEK